MFLLVRCIEYRRVFVTFSTYFIYGVLSCYRVIYVYTFLGPRVLCRKCRTLSPLMTGSGGSEAGSNGDEDELTPQQSDTGGQQEAKLSRQYPASHKGPYVVYIRQRDKKLLYLALARKLNMCLRSVVLIEKKSETRMKVTLSSREEANKLIVDEYLKEYHVYLPADDVEISGVIQLPTDIERDTIVNDGWGSFKLPGISLIRPVEAYRFKKISGDGEEVLSESVKVTFPGRVLPDYFVMYGLRMRLDLYRRKAMFCSKCGSLNHTERGCTNDPKCRVCKESHYTRECKIKTTEIVCNLCKEEHGLDVKECPKYRAASKNRIAAIRASSQKSYADMVRAHESNNIFEVLTEVQEEETSDSSQRAPKRKKSTNGTATRVTSAQGSGTIRRKTTQVRQPTVKATRKTSTDTPPQRPPGFSSENPLIMTLRQVISSLLTNLNVDPNWMPFIQMCVDFVFDRVFPILSESLFRSTPSKSDHHESH